MAAGVAPMTLDMVKKSVQAAGGTVKVEKVGSPVARGGSLVRVTIVAPNGEALGAGSGATGDDAADRAACAVAGRLTPGRWVEIWADGLVELGMKSAGVPVKL